MATTYSGAVIRTTHVTGIVTDLGIAVGQTARREQIDRRRMGLYLVLFVAFFLGGVGGMIGFHFILNSAVKTRSTRRPQSRKDGIAVSEMFTCEVKVQLGLRDGFLLCVLRDLRVSIEFFRFMSYDVFLVPAGFPGMAGVSYFIYIKQGTRV